MRNSGLTEVLQDFISLFYPRYCLGCYGALVKGEEMVCTECMVEMPQTGFHLDYENPLKKRLSVRIPLQYGMALFRFTKSGSVQGLLHTLKYKSQPEVGIALGKLYGEKLVAAGLHREFDLIIPIPLHSARRRKRGYNQSAKFAEGLSEKLHIPFSDNLVLRKIKTETQTRKSKLSRWENVREVFEVSDTQAIVNKRVLLVDDVVTTGATIEACGQMLLNAGCRNLSVACIAVA
jgi:ComF family protein